MMLVIPFANQVGPASGPQSDGVIYGVLPNVPVESALTTASLAEPNRVMRGNADAAGSVTYSDVTQAAASLAVNDVSLFDTVNPTVDRLCIDLSPGDRVIGIALQISTAAVLSGTPVADVYYRASTGWVSATAVITPSLTAVGTAVISFDEIAYADTIAIDNLIDPRLGTPQRCLFVQFSGITAVTTAPLFSRIWIRRASTGVLSWANYTGLIAQQSANPNFGPLTGAHVLPRQNDKAIFGWSERPARIHALLYRVPFANGAREWVYSRSDGTFPAVPVASLRDTSQGLSAPLSAPPGTLVRRIRVRLSGSTANFGTHIRNLDIRDAAGVRIAAAAVTLSTGVNSAGTVANTAGEPFSAAFDADQNTYWNLGDAGANSALIFQEAILTLNTPTEIRSILMASYFGAVRTYAMGSVDVAFDRDDGGLLADGSDARWWPVISARQLVVATANNDAGNTFTGIPTGATQITEWFRPDGLAAGALATWADALVPTIDLTQSVVADQPTVVTNVANGQSVVRFDGGTEWLDLSTDRTDVRAVFLVLRKDAAVSGQLRFILGDETSFHFHPGGAGQILDTGSSSASVRNGTVRLNGAVVAPTTTNFPTTLSLLSYETTGNVEIGNIGRDRAIAGRNWQGDLAELLVLNSLPTTAEREAIEGYLAWKYGLQTSLPVGHTYASAAPTVPAQPVEISILPPTDWGKSEITDANGVVHSRYWIGLNNTVDALEPSLAGIFTMQGQPVRGAGVRGIPAPATEAITALTVAARVQSLGPSGLVIANASTGDVAAVSVPAGSSIATVSATMAVSKGDNIVLYQPTGHATVNLEDGAVFAS